MTAAPTTSQAFDRAYSLPITLWGDVRIPEEIKALARHGIVRSSLELGCGLGRFSLYLAQLGIAATGVDFSPVAIGRAKQRAAAAGVLCDYQVGDVTNLEALRAPFDVSFDVGCFHCLDANAQQRYVAEVSRLLRPGGTHLMWALDGAPSDQTLSPDVMRKVFAPHFELRDAQLSRRRLIRSHWYWLASTR